MLIALSFRETIFERRAVGVRGSRRLEVRGRVVELRVRTLVEQHTQAIVGLAGELFDCACGIANNTALTPPARTDLIEQLRREIDYTVRKTGIEIDVARKTQTVSFQNDIETLRQAMYKVGLKPYSIRLREDQCPTTLGLRT
jgi:hypothetical protein